MMNIWKNSFKSGKEIKGTKLKNGQQSRINLSRLNECGRATISFSITAAIVALIEGRVSVGKTKDGDIICESKSLVRDRKYVSIYRALGDKLESFIVEEGIDISSYEHLVDVDFSHWSLFVPRVAEIISHSESEEFSEYYKEALETFEKEGIFPNGPMFVLNDYLYLTKDNFIQTYDDIILTTPRDMEIMDITHKFSNKPGEFDFAFDPRTIEIVGKTEEEKKVEDVKKKEEKKKEKKAKTETPKGEKAKKSSFELDWDKELTDTEKSLIPKLDFSVVKIPNEVKELAHMIKEESNSTNAVRNILLYGGAGAGKSTGSRILAQLLGVPYRFITCSLNTEESDFVGDYAPNTEGGFDFIMPAFAETFVNGGIIEVQEPTTLKAGVGVALNSATDDTNKITLRNGEVVERHKNCIVVFTTNVEYSGCNRMNGSVKSRFQQKLHIEKLPNKELIQIVSEQSGNENLRLISKLVDAVEKMSIKIEEEQISDATCSTRELIDWARDIKYTNDPIRSAMKTAIPSISFDMEIQQEIVDTILKPMF